MEKRDKFSDQWSNAFEGAELAPDKAVWAGIHAEMANQSADKYKRSAFYFKWMAAASVTLLIGCIAAASYYYYSEKGVSEVNTPAIASNNNSNPTDNESSNDVSLKNNQKSGVAEQLTKSSQVIISTNGGIDSKLEGTNSKTTTIISNSETRSISTDPVSNDSTNHSVVYESGQGFVAFEIDNKSENKRASIIDHGNTTHDTVIKYSPRMSRIDRREYSALVVEPQDEVYLQSIPELDGLILNIDKSGYRDLWAGLSFSGGNFDPNMSYDQSSTAFAALEDQGINNFSNAAVVDAQATQQTPAFSYGIGFDFGKRLGSKLVIQSGLNYQKYASETISSFELQNVASGQNEAYLLTADQSLEANQILNYSDTYQVNNEFEYLSVPIEIGYLVVDRKVGFLLSSGIATDLFIKNTISDESNLREDVTINNGSNSPYKTLNLNGLIGGEFYYTINKNYVVALEPSYKFSIDGITKSEANFLSKPHSLFIGFKFKYFIK